MRVYLLPEEFPREGMAFCLNLNSTLGSGAIAAGSRITGGAGADLFRGTWKSIFSSSFFSLQMNSWE